MTNVVRLLLLAVVIVFGTAPVRAADVTCLQTWGKVVPTVPVDKKEDPAGYVSGVRMPLISGHFLKFWPSGYRPSVESCYVAILKGKIEKGDYERFREFLGEHYKAMWAVHLVSPGGDVREGLKIGRLLRKYLFHVEAPFMIEKNIFIALGHPPSLDGALCKGATCVCASSCALIWFGAIERGGVVGLHRPKITDPQFAALPPDQASKQYREVLQKISQYLEEMEVPRSLIEAMEATGSSDIRWVDAPPDGSGAKNRSPSYTEWIDANCEPLTAQDYGALRQLRARETQYELDGRTYPLTRSDKLLMDRQGRRILCAAILEFSQRDKMSPP